MITEIHDVNPSTAAPERWRIRLRPDIGETRVDFFRLKAHRPGYSCFIASYYLSNLLQREHVMPLYPDPGNPHLTLSTDGARQLQQWLRQVANAQ